MNLCRVTCLDFNFEKAGKTTVTEINKMKQFYLHSNDNPI